MYPWLSMYLTRASTIDEFLDVTSTVKLYRIVKTSYLHATINPRSSTVIKYQQQLLLALYDIRKHKTPSQFGAFLIYSIKAQKFDKVILMGTKNVVYP